MFFNKESQHHRDLCYRWKCNPIKLSYRWVNAIQQKYHQSFCLFAGAKQVDDEVHVGEQTSKKKKQAIFNILKIVISRRKERIGQREQV